ncbi:methyl-accepting chemotaxis protein [Brevibacillus panacihumi]|uniref:methyl-accepting chemotaxis protein n=1 Tax=Brevibacillus panacihumi TaxID=497735 RepID=UPI003CFF6080
MKKAVFKFTIAKKIVSGFLSVLLLFTIVSWIAMVQIKNVDWTYSNLLMRHSLVIENVQLLKKEMIVQENALRGYLLTEDTSYVSLYEASEMIFQTALDEFATTAPNEEAKEQIADLTMAYDKYHSLMRDLIDMNQQNPELAKIQFQNSTISSAGSIFHEQADNILNIAKSVMEKDQNKAKETTTFIITMLIVATLIALVMGLAISIWIGRFISKPVIQVSESMKKLAEGDFSIEPIRVRNRDEIGVLVDSMNQMVDDLRKILVQVSESSEYIAASTEELSASTEQSAESAAQVADLSQKNAIGAEKQLETFKATALKVEEIAEEVDHISQSSESMLSATESATKMTQQGAISIHNVLSQMNAIHTSTEETSALIRSLDERSKQITDIVSLITAISEQTNLLALNAAIEAARAGEHGRGFAVVAEEVRKLAEESRKSAEQVIEMTSLIQQGTIQAVGAMENGNMLVQEGLTYTEQAEQAFAAIEAAIDNVNHQVREVNESVEEIRDFSRQVAAGIEEVTSISDQVLQLSQESSTASEEQLATSEEITSSVQNLAALADDMKQQITRFRIS